MATNLGKRKRQGKPSVEDDADDPRDDAATRALFQRAFEKKFKALETKPLNRDTNSSKVELDVESDSEESDWEGLSDESQNAVQIVDYTQSNGKTDDGAIVDKSLEKLFMVSLVCLERFRNSVDIYIVYETSSITRRTHSKGSEGGNDGG
jgi:hypothetical protein